ncbi:MAG: hypothetical protein R3E32_14500 [Chitinophagales bacterium]
MGKELACGVMGLVVCWLLGSCEQELLDGKELACDTMDLLFIGFSDF